MTKKIYVSPECNQLDKILVPHIICDSLNVVGIEGFSYDPDDDDYNYDF